MKKHVEMLKNMSACSDAVDFADQHRSLKAAWEACRRPDWMLWLLNQIHYPDDKAYRLFACWCVRNTPLTDGRKVWDLLTDKRSRDAVEVAERYAVGEATPPEEMALRCDQAQWLQHAIAQLPAETRSVLTLRYWGDLSCEEIAAATGATVNAVKSRLHRGRTALAELLAREERCAAPRFVFAASPELAAAA